MKSPGPDQFGTFGADTDTDVRAVKVNAMIMNEHKFPLTPQIFWTGNTVNGGCGSVGRVGLLPIRRSVVQSLLRSTCPSILGQDAELQIAPNGCATGE